LIIIRKMLIAFLREFLNKFLYFSF